MSSGQGLREITIAFIGDNDAAAGLGNEEVRTGNTDISVQITLSQHPACLVNQLSGLRQGTSRRQIIVQAAEVRLNLLLIKMHRRCDDMAGGLPAELDDILAQIGLNGLDTSFLKKIIEADLLGYHRFSLGDHSGIQPAADRQDGPAGLLGGRTPVHLAAAFNHLCFVAFQVEVEVSKRMILDGSGLIAQPVELRKARGRLAAFTDKAAAHMPHGLLQQGIFQGSAGIFREGVRGRLHHHPLRCFSALFSGSPIAGTSCWPASTSATWRTAIAEPRRWSLPAIFIRQPRSPASRSSAPLSSMFSTFFVTIESDICGYLTQKVPPKPQQASVSAISASFRPCMPASSLRG